MKQVLQSARDGEVSVVDVPAPQLLPGCVLVRVAASLVSAGTERAASEFAGKNLVQKAKARPDLVRDVLTKLRRDGLVSTMDAVRSRLDQPLALGYSSSGTILAVGEGVSDFCVGDRVACAGAGYAVHAEFACVPRLLVVKIPRDDVPFEEAAFTTIGAVAMHGVRTAGVQLGDAVAVIGLGLLGQLTVQILKSAGCRVIGFDINPARASLASRQGADHVCDSATSLRDLCQQVTKGQGVDSVLITAETSSSGPVNLAGAVARERAVVVAVGTVGMDIERKAYYEKELDFRISRSYGPGRYDAAFEQKGRDYPIGYVRWTETRNMESFLALLAEGKVDVSSIVTHKFPIARAREAYDLITGKTGEVSLGVLITYPEAEAASARVDLKPLGQAAAVSLGVLGAGAFALNTLLPVIKQSGEGNLVGICSATGTHSRYAADRFDFRFCASDENEVLRDSSINTVVIATRHHLHGGQVVAALEAGKHVFCEKPLCLSEDELAAVVRAYNARPDATALMVGFNRRFAPMTCRLKEFLAAIREPLLMHYRVNAGFLPPDHWTQDPEQGGGRLLGEVCHFIDLLSFLSGAEPVQVTASAASDASRYSGDNLTVLLRFANGSQGSITYAANGDRSYSKERIEIFGGGSVAVLDDFRQLELVRNGKKTSECSSLRQDKGHAGEWREFAAAVRSGKKAPMGFEEIVASSLATLRAHRSCQTGTTVSVGTAEFIASALHPSDASGDNESER
jgi:predicted dehydrogenase/threonine dehydrogenase-like Zn-dependent dehydrogenase